VLIPSHLKCFTATLTETDKLYSHLSVIIICLAKVHLKTTTYQRTLFCFNATCSTLH